MAAHLAVWFENWILSKDKLEMFQAELTKILKWPIFSQHVAIVALEVSMMRCRALKKEPGLLVSDEDSLNK